MKQQENYILMNSTKFIFFICLIFTNCLVGYQDTNSNESCVNSLSKNQVIDENYKPIKSFYIIGHGYGNHSGENSGLSEKVVEYFSSLEEKASVIFTGDLVREPTSENLDLLVNQLDSLFVEYYISPGNHEFKNKEEFYKRFNDDLNYLSFEFLDLFIINTTTNNWQPSLQQQNEINKYLSESDSQFVILFNHQLFWQKIVSSPIEPNGYNLLETELNENYLSWIKIDNKFLTVISGDFGRRDKSLICEFVESENTLFIANGIYDQTSDEILKLNIYESSYNFEIISLP